MEPSSANLLRPGQRTLAAIVFTDVVSFSARMQADEESTLRLLQRDFGTMRELAAQHQGSVLKTTGDGLLLYFSSAVQAVACALAMQRHFAEHGRKLPAAQVLVHRLGIHLGDVFVSEQDVMGDGVNIAARLQAEAEPGGICISQTVYDVVKNKLTLHVTSLGARELKNITESIPIYRLLLQAQAMNGGDAVPVAPGSAAPGGSGPAKAPSRSPIFDEMKQASAKPFVAAAAAARSRSFRIAAGAVVLLILGLIVMTQVRARNKLRQERAEIDAARAALNTAIEQASASAAKDQEEVSQALTGLRPQMPQIRNQYLSRYDFAGLAQWLRLQTGRGEQQQPGLGALQRSAEQMAVTKEWVITQLQRRSAQDPLVTHELTGSAPKELRVFAGGDRQLYFVEGGAVRSRSWANVQPSAVGALVVGTMVSSPQPPPRDVVQGALAFSNLYNLPEMREAMRARRPRR